MLSWPTLLHFGGQVFNTTGHQILRDRKEALSVAVLFLVQVQIQKQLF